MKCETHPRYLGRSVPRVACTDCWGIYWERHCGDCGRMFSDLDRQCRNKACLGYTG